MSSSGVLDRSPNQSKKYTNLLDTNKSNDTEKKNSDENNSSNCILSISESDRVEIITTIKENKSDDVDDLSSVILKKLRNNHFIGSLVKFSANKSNKIIGTVTRRCNDDHSGKLCYDVEFMNRIITNVPSSVIRRASDLPLVGQIRQFILIHAYYDKEVGYWKLNDTEFINFPESANPVCSLIEEELKPCTDEDIVQPENINQSQENNVVQSIEIISDKQMDIEAKEIIPGEQLDIEANEIIPGEQLDIEAKEIIPGEQLDIEAKEIISGEQVDIEANEIIPGEKMLTEDKEIISDKQMDIEANEKMLTEDKEIISDKKVVNKSKKVKTETKKNIADKKAVTKSKKVANKSTKMDIETKKVFSTTENTEICSPMNSATKNKKAQKNEKSTDIDVSTKKRKKSLPVNSPALKENNSSHSFIQSQSKRKSTNIINETPLVNKGTSPICGRSVSSQPVHTRNKLNSVGFEPVELLGEFTSHEFTKIIFITQFITIFHEFLKLEQDEIITFDKLTTSLIGENSRNGELFTRVISTFLVTLFEDRNSDVYRDIGVPLTEVRINKYTLSELVRLVLLIGMRSNNVLCDSSSEIILFDSIRSLQLLDIFDLNLKSKLLILEALADLVIQTELFRNYIPLSTNEISNYSHHNKNGPKNKEHNSSSNNFNISFTCDCPQCSIQSSVYSINDESEYESKLSDDKSNLSANVASDHFPMLRMNPLGHDEHYDRYWIFDAQCVEAGVYVERGGKLNWHYSTTDGWFYKNKKRLVDQWLFCNDITALDDRILPLLNSKNGSKLAKQYKKCRSKILKSIKDPCDNSTYLDTTMYGDYNSFDLFRRYLMETETKMRLGWLGSLSDLEEWRHRLFSSSNLSGLAQCLIDVYDSLTLRFTYGVLMKTKANNTQSQRQKARVRRWRLAVKKSGTCSRLHVLLGMLDSCIKWNKSTTNKYCRTCRKKNTKRQLICQDCDNTYHPSCLKPPPTVVNFDQIWYCNQCQKQIDASLKAKSAKAKILNPRLCCVCNSDEDLIICDQCLLAYHLECHEPQLLLNPRERFVCRSCQRQNLSIGSSSVKMNFGSKPKKNMSSAEKKICLQMFSKLCSHQACWPFVKPQDLCAEIDCANVSDAIDVDFIGSKLKDDDIESFDEFVELVNKLFESVLLQFSWSPPISNCANKLKTYFADLVMEYDE